MGARKISKTADRYIEELESKKGTIGTDLYLVTKDNLNRIKSIAKKGSANEESKSRKRTFKIVGDE